MPSERAIERFLGAVLIISVGTQSVVLGLLMRVRPSDVQNEVRVSFETLNRRIDGVQAGVRRIDIELGQRLTRLDDIDRRLNQHEKQAAEWIDAARARNPELELPDLPELVQALEQPPMLMLRPEDE